MPADSSVRTLLADAIDDEARRSIAALLLMAVPGFYNLLPMDENARIDALKPMIGQPGTETSNILGAFANGALVGALSWLDASTLEAARRLSTMTLIRTVPRAALSAFLAETAAYAKTVEPFSGDGVYLARVAVDPMARGSGAGRDLVRCLIDLDPGQPVWLHVARDNDRAIGLYRSLGFEFESEEDYASRVMVRKPASA